MDLLFGENVLLLAKVASAAENHSDEYVSYSTLMSANGNDLVRMFGQAFGNTAASEFGGLWSAQESAFVDYTIGVVTHDAGKASAALASLNTTEPEIARLLMTLLNLSGSLVERFSGQVAPIKGFIDAGFAQNVAVMYRQIDIAFIGAAGLGDLLAPRIAARFPDKFPGDASSVSVVRRALANERLMERAYLETMVTDALAGGRAAEAVQALTTPGLNPDALATSLGHTDLAFIQAWQQRTGALEQYASGGGQPARDALEKTFVPHLAALTGVAPSELTAQVDATLLVIDDQRARRYDALPGDDRAAATAMQPIADAVAA